MASVKITPNQPVTVSADGHSLLLQQGDDMIAVPVDRWRELVDKIKAAAAQADPAVEGHFC